MHEHEILDFSDNAALEKITQKNYKYIPCKNCNYINTEIDSNKRKKAAPVV